MTISVHYSVKAKDIEEARAWIEKVTGLEAEGRESSFCGGDYYAFKGRAGEELKLFKNIDIHDGQPIIGASRDWSLALLFDGPPESVLRLSLGECSDKFAMIREAEY